MKTNINKKIFGLALMAMPLIAAAQTTLCTFDADDYGALSVFDSWDESPFVTGALQGNVAVVSNPAPDDGNRTAKVLGVQRSRFGSNKFGAKIRLKTPFELTTATRYVHVLINKPVAGRVMLIGLGKRDNRAAQSDQVEQFWELSTVPAAVGQWYDAVFAVKGNGGISISSLVVVPDCESSHALADDFVAYVDEIEISDKATPRFRTGDYPVNFDPAATHTRSERVLSAISLTGTQSSTQTMETGNTASPYTLYRPLLTGSFAAKAGETLTPSFSYNGKWMHGYVYIDLDQDGKFDYTLNGHVPAEGSELMSFNFYSADGTNSGYNSTGKSVNHDNENGSPMLSSPLPSFRLPATLPNGFYRMRYKVDWNEVDPAASSTIIENAGAVIDVRLNVHADQSRVSVTARNGEILKADGSVLSGGNVPFGQPLTITMQPALGFKQNGIIIRHGYLSGDSFVHGTPQWETVQVPAFLFRDNRYTLPASYMDGDIEIIAEFAEDKGAGEASVDYPLNFDGATLTVNRPDKDRYLRGVSIVNGAGKSFSIAASTTQPIAVYQDLTDKTAFVTTGTTVQPKVTYTNTTSGTMDGYLYIDYDNDGRFYVDVGTSHRPTIHSELVSFSHLNGYNSAGEATGSNAAITLPVFDIPAQLPVGIYRARLKIDTNNADPGGRYGSAYTDDLIQDNGGKIIDFLLNVSDGARPIELKTEHGNIYGASHAALPVDIVPGNAALTFVPVPVKSGYVLERFVVKHGYNFEGDSIVHGNRQWTADTVAIAPDSETATYTLDAKRVDGDVEATAIFRNASSAYTMVWHDEFEAADGTQPDAAKWNRCPRYSSTWNRFMSDTADVCIQQNGRLKLRAIPNRDTSKDKASMLTGGVQSNGKYSFLHGRIECRALVNPHAGNFPAFWLMPEDGSDGWPACGEIDIMEQINTEDKAYHTVHTNWTWTLGHRNDATPKTSFSETVDMAKYHTYALEWTEDSLFWFVDGTQRGFYGREPAHAADKQWPYDKAFYIILNQAVGDGSWASSPDLTHTYEMDVDWVRVYQKNDADGIGNLHVDNSLKLTIGEGSLTLYAETPQYVQVSDLQGRQHYQNTLYGSKTLQLHRGIYLVGQRKVVVP